jgi:hypothetical protein
MSTEEDAGYEELEARDPEVAKDFEFTRRRLLASGATIGAAAFLAACGSSSKSSGGGSAATTTSGGGASSTSAATTTSSGGGSAASGLGGQLQGILGTPKNLIAKGPGTFKVAGQFALTGAGSIYGVLQSDGFKYGAEHVKAWSNGKLDMTGATYYDNKSGVPAAEASAGRQAGLSKVPVLINSYIFGFGAVIPYAKQFKMFCPDPGGGQGPVPGPWAGAPYCYGFRAAYPTDPLDGIVKYVTTKYPTKKNWVVVQPVIAPAYNDAVTAYANKLFAQYSGLKVVGAVQAPLGATDYSATVQKIKALNPDVVLWTNFGTDPGYCAREMSSQGVTALNCSVDFTATAAKIAGSAYKGWLMGFDYLNSNNPPNDWSKFFVKNWAKDHGGQVANFYNAGDYITAFAVAELMDRILGAGGDISDGSQYVKQLEANPSFDHVYGGSGSTIGKIVIDTTTHSPKSLEMLMFEAQGTGNIKDIKPLATYNIKAADFKLL